MTFHTQRGLLMHRTARWSLLGLLGLGCSTTKIEILQSPDGGVSGGADAGAAGRTGTPSAGNSGDEAGASGSNNDAGAAGSDNDNDGGSPSAGGSANVGGMSNAGSAGALPGGTGGLSGGGASGAGGGGASGAGAGGGGASGAGAGGGGASGGGAGGASAGTGGASGGGASGGGSGGSGGGSDPITQVLKSAGCGMTAPGAFSPGATSAAQTIHTSGTKAINCADSACGAWAYDRQYYVTLPSGYDPTKAYPLVFEGPGCGGSGQDVYPLTDPAASTPNAANTVIRVGLTPPPNAIGHSTNPNQGCFDVNEGDDSVEWPLYENLYDKLTSSLCVDRQRVFASGSSFGGSLANELGCKYAGDATRPIRGVLVNTGGLPTAAAFVPTCTNKPMAGMWVGESGDAETPFAGNVNAINRAIAVNKCTGGDWPTTPTQNYAIAGGNLDSVCKAITGCPALTPLVVCLISGNQHATHDTVVNPGFSTFLEAFEKTPLLNP